MLAVSISWRSERIPSKNITSCSLKKTTGSMLGGPAQHRVPVPTPGQIRGRAGSPDGDRSGWEGPVAPGRQQWVGRGDGAWRDRAWGLPDTGQLEAAAHAIARRVAARRRVPPAAPFRPHQGMTQTGVFGSRPTLHHLPHGKSATLSSSGRVAVWGAGVPVTRTSLGVLAGSIVPASVQWSRTKGRLVAVRTSGPSASWKCRWGAVELPVLPSRPSTWPVVTVSPAWTWMLPGCRWA